MRVITRSELAYRSKYDLDAIHALVLREIADAKQGSPELHSAMVSLENIRREQGARKTPPKASRSVDPRAQQHPA
ncbi:hypothetical protein [Acidicapsa acidisoli]|uniref:hypothetical protein n=1 Tax=Acidicapsa acidisoli TaxID=1615681 RepID=UPI0021E04C08|nr:hypothetical protein [Acidicapsa acidisoli]